MGTLRIFALAACALAGLAPPARAEAASYLEIRRLLGASQYASAAAAATQAIRDDARSYRVLEALVEAHAAQGAPASALVVLEERLRDDPENAYLHYASGLAHQNAADYEPALRSFRRAAEIAPTFALSYREIAYTHRLRKTETEGRAELEARLASGTAAAAAHYGLGFVDGLAGETARAIEQLDRALDLDADLLDAYRYASQLHFRAGDFDEALGRARELHQRALAQGDPLHLAAALNTMAAASLRLAAYEEAITSYETALAAQRDLGDRQGQWSSLDGLGVAYENLGRHTRARERHRQALEVAEPLSNRRWTATTLHNIGVTYAQERNMPEARRHYFQALGLRRTALDRGGQAYTLRDIGMSYLREGQPARARQYLEEARAAAAAVQDALLHAAIETMVAETYERVGASDEARRHYESARAEAQRIRHPELVWRVRRGLGRVSEAQGRVAEAEEHYTAAVATIEGVRQNVRDESALTVFLQGRLSAYESLVSFLYRRHRRAPAEGHDRRALEYAERAKARAFLDLLAEAGADVRKGMTPAEQTEERRLLRATARAQRTLLRAGTTEVQRAAGERELAALETQLEEFERELRRRRPEYATLRRPEPERLDTLQAELLRGSDGLVEFMLGDEASFAWLLTPRGLKMVALPARAAIERQVARYRTHIRQPPTRAQAVLDTQRSGQDLFQTLLGPFAAQLTRTARLTIVPDGILHLLPFETLVSGLDARGEPRYLVASHDVVYAPSASILVGLGRRARPSGSRLDLLAYGDPQLAAPAASSTPAARDRALGPLPHARREIESIAALFPAERCRVRLGREATESALKREELSRCSILHLATHGHTDARVPARSGLLLAPGAPEEDGLLQGIEIVNLSLDADLVVLSACGSGLGRLVQGEGLVGVTRSFLSAGARSLVVSLWDVDDASTATLMTSFYRRLRHGGDAARALREAKQEIVRSDRPAHHFPYYWASFVLVGQNQALFGGTGSPAP